MPPLLRNSQLITCILRLELRQLTQLSLGATTSTGLLHLNSNLRSMLMNAPKPWLMPPLLRNSQLITCILRLELRLPIQLPLDAIAMVLMYTRFTLKKLIQMKTMNLMDLMTITCLSLRNTKLITPICVPHYLQLFLCKLLTLSLSNKKECSNTTRKEAFHALHPASCYLDLNELFFTSSVEGKICYAPCI